MRYFNNSMKERYRRNVITLVKGTGGSVDGVEEVKEAIKIYFEEFFKEHNPIRHVLEGLRFNRMNEHDSEWLERVFTKEEEVKVVVLSCDGNKSVGPDGFMVFHSLYGK